MIPAPFPGAGAPGPGRR